MKKVLSSFEIACVVEELSFLKRGIIDTIQMPEKKELLLGIHIAGTGKSYLRIIAGKALFLTPEKRNAKTLSGFSAFLRKYLDQARVTHVEQIPNDRVVLLHCDSRHGEMDLVVELFGKGNILLVKEGIILGCAEQQEWKERSVKSGERFISNIRRALSEKELEKMSHISKAESLIKFLALEAGCGGVYAEELCLRTGLDKNTPLCHITSIEIRKLCAAWNALRNDLKAGYCVFKEGILIDVTPIALLSYRGLETKQFPTYSEALAYAWRQEQELPEVLILQKKLAKLATIINEQEKNVARWEQERAEASQTADYIYHHYLEIKELLEKARESFQKNKPMPSVVTEIKRKEKQIIAEL